MKLQDWRLLEGPLARGVQLGCSAMVSHAGVATARRVMVWWLSGRWRTAVRRVVSLARGVGAHEKTRGSVARAGGQGRGQKMLASGRMSTGMPQMANSRFECEGSQRVAGANVDPADNEMLARTATVFKIIVLQAN